MKSELLIVYTLLSFSIQAQTWQWAESNGKPYYADEAIGVSIDAKNSIYVSCVSKNVCHHCPSRYANYLSKYDPQGKVLWTDTLMLNDAAISTNGSGETYAASGSKLIKVASDGQIIFTKSDSTIGINKLLVLPSGEFLAAGYNPNVEGKIVLARFDSNGNAKWKRFSDTWAHCCRSEVIAADKYENLYFAGGEDTSSTGNKGILLCVNKQGSLVNSFNIPYDPIALQVDNSGNVYMMGLFVYETFLGGSTYAPSASNGYIAKYSPNGTLLWHKLISADFLNLRDLHLDNNGNVLLVGDFTKSLSVAGSSFSGNYTSFLLSFDSSGSLSWSTTNILNTSKSFSATKALTVDAANRVIVVGSARGNLQYGSNSVVTQEPESTTFYDVLVAKLENAKNATSLSEENNEGGSLLAFPNPSQGIFAVEVPQSAVGKINLSVANLLGQIIMSDSRICSSELNTVQIDLGHAPKGAYILTLVKENGETFSARLLLQ